MSFQLFSIISGAIPLPDQQCHFKISMGPGHVGKLHVMSMLIPLLKLEPSCPVPTALVFCSLSPTIAEIHYTQCHKWKRYISQSHQIVKFLQFLQCWVELVLPHPLSCELSCFCCHGYSLLPYTYAGKSLRLFQQWLLTTSKRFPTSPSSLSCLRASTQIYLLL